MKVDKKSAKIKLESLTRWILDRVFLQIKLLQQLTVADLWWEAGHLVVVDVTDPESSQPSNLRRQLLQLIVRKKHLLQMHKAANAAWHFGDLIGKRSPITF